VMTSLRLTCATRRKAWSTVVAKVSPLPVWPVMPPPNCNRNSASAPFANGLVQAVFATPEGGFVRGHGRQGNTFIVARVKQIVVPSPPTGEDAERLDASLETALEADLFEQYVGGLQGRYGVSVNANVLAALTGEAGGRSEAAPGHASLPPHH